AARRPDRSCGDGRHTGPGFSPQEAPQALPLVLACRRVQQRWRLQLLLLEVAEDRSQFLEAQILRLHLLMHAGVCRALGRDAGGLFRTSPQRKLPPPPFRDRRQGKGEQQFSAGAVTMWKAAREEFKEIVWLVCIVGGLSVLAVASAAALAAG